MPSENNLLQYYLNDAQKFTTENKMIINKKKTQVMIFNKSRKFDFPPELKFSDGSQVDLISETKLLGVILTDNMSWHSNTTYICQKAREKLWTLRRMLQLSLDDSQLYDVYCKEIRSILEFGVPVWHPGLTLKDSTAIERLQKVSFKIILQDKYVNYQIACQHFNTTTLEARREKLCMTFATTNLKSEKTFFTPAQQTVNTRSKKKKVKEFRCRTSRFQKSSLPYMARLLNTTD